ncbi:hypothetical protein BFP49_21455 [Bacillus licheniformis]|nr:hypothetical protein BFP49_21455 [Bacillus licheniformis]
MIHIITTLYFTLVKVYYTKVNKSSSIFKNNDISIRRNIVNINIIYNPYDSNDSIVVNYIVDSSDINDTSDINIITYIKFNNDINYINNIIM